MRRGLTAGRELFHPDLTLAPELTPQSGWLNCSRVSLADLLQPPGDAKAHEMKEGAKEEMKEHGMAGNAKEHGHLDVTNLTMVSETCQQ